MDIVKENVEIIVEDRGEVVTLSIQDGAFTNNIDDKSGIGDIDHTWSADKLTKEFNNKVDKMDDMGLSETSFSLSEKTKLQLIEDLSTHNLPDDVLLNRNNHTGTQDIDTIEGLTEVINSLEDVINSILGDKTELVEDVENLKEAVAGNNANITLIQKRVVDLELKVSSHITYADNRMAALEMADNNLNNRISVLSVKVDGKVDKVDGKQLSTEDYTRAEKNKLATIEGSKYRGQFKDEASLPPTGGAGWYADVDGGIGRDVYRVVWDVTDNKWVKQGGVSSSLTDSQIKQQYENNPDTNAFTDSEKLKLSYVDDAATKNRPDNLNADKDHTHNIEDITGLSKELLDRVSFNEVTSTPSPNKVLKLNNSGMVDRSVLPASSSEDVELGFGLSRDKEDKVRLGKLLDNGYEDTHVIDLNDLGDYSLFAIGRDFDNYGMLTKGIVFLKDYTGIREGEAKLLIRKGSGVVNVDSKSVLTEDQIRMMCTIEMNAPNTSIFTGSGRQFLVWHIEGTGYPVFSVSDGSVYAFEQDYNRKPEETSYRYNAKVVTLGYFNQVVDTLSSRIDALEEALREKNDG